MPAAETQQQVVTYTPISSAEQARDLLLLEQGAWGNYCGVLTRVNFVRYLRQAFFGEPRPPDEDEEDGGGFVNCCGFGDALYIPVHVYLPAGDVPYQLRATAGTLGEGVWETIVERESITFALETEATIRHPASEIVSARWLTGPWTTGGAEVAPPALAVEGQTVRAPIPLFGSVELTLRVRRWRHILTIPKEEAEELLINGWAEYVMALPSGGRPVGQEITEPPGAAELARGGFACGRGRGGDSGTINGPDDDDDEPTASPADKHIRCDYCELECEDPDAEEK